MDFDPIADAVVIVRILGAPPREREDAQAAGLLRLAGALAAYDASHGASLRTYAHHQISGGARDYLRSIDPCSRQHRKLIRHGALPEIHLVPLDRDREHGRDESRAIHARIDSERAMMALSTLPEPSQRIIRGYFLEDRPMSALAREMRLEVSKAFRVRSSALQELRTQLLTPVSGRTQ